jgi:hypothetical protein
VLSIGRLFELFEVKLGVKVACLDELFVAAAFDDFAVSGRFS